MQVTNKVDNRIAYYDEADEECKSDSEDGFRCWPMVSSRAALPAFDEGGEL